jgi:uncharacterized RDD family membrane protein YckC
VITALTEYAGFWRRAFAFWIDWLWMGPLVLFLSYFICGGSECTDLQNSMNPMTSLEDFDLRNFLVQEFLPALLILWFWIKYSGTPGKMLLDCEIVDARTGEQIDFKQIILRYLGYIVSALPFGLGFLWIMLDKRKQGWHDKIAGTVVIIHDEATVPLSQLQESLL